MKISKKTKEKIEKIVKENEGITYEGFLNKFKEEKEINVEFLVHRKLEEEKDD